MHNHSPHALPEPPRSTPRTKLKLTINHDPVEIPAAAIVALEPGPEKAPRLFRSCILTLVGSGRRMRVAVDQSVDIVRARLRRARPAPRRPRLLRALIGLRVHTPSHLKLRTTP